jgi:hypothetical protein
MWYEVPSGGGKIWYVIKNCDKKDAIQSNNESIQLYEDEQKSLQEKLKKLNEKEQDLVMKWKKEGGLKRD